jgi:hypothetical protein
MRALSILLVLAISVVGVPVTSAPATFTLWLRAHPQAIVADGRSETTISAEVRDPNGNPVPDGTIVDFTSSIGTIERTARTSAGVARARLQSAVNVGTAMVSAVVTNGNAVGTIRVDFLTPGTEMFDESFITISSKKYLGYDVNGRVVDAAGGVIIAHRGLTINAEEAQIDLKTNVLRAKCKMGADNIVIRRGDKRIEASQLYYDFTSMNGVLLAPAADGAKRMTFRGRDLFTQAATEDADQKRSLDYKPIAEAAMFIKASSMVIRPGEEVKFKRAAFYMDGTKMLSVPLYVVNLHGQSGTANQMVTYGTSGLRMDLPLYYSLTPTSTGSLRLRRSEPGAWGYDTARPGWQLDLEQDYNSGGSTEGAFTLDRVTSASDWGARWTHRKEFNNDSQLYSYVDFPSHRSLFGSMNFSRQLPNYTLSVNGRANKLVNSSGSLASDAYIQTRAKPLLGGAVNYSFTSKINADTSIANRFGTGVGMQLYGKPTVIRGLGNLTTALVTGHNWGAYGGSTVMADTGLYRAIGSSGSFGLDYTYSWGDSALGYTQQRISANLNLSRSAKWNLYAYATKGITDRSMSAFGSLNYILAPTWRFGLLGTYQAFQSYRYPDAEFSLTKGIGRQDMSIIWSTSRQRFRIEFSALKF